MGGIVDKRVESWKCSNPDECAPCCGGHSFCPWRAEEVKQVWDLPIQDSEMQKANQELDSSGVEDPVEVLNAADQWRYAYLGKACEQNGIAGFNEKGEHWFMPPIDMIQEQAISKFAQENLNGLVPREISEHPLFQPLADAIRQAMYGKGTRHGGTATPFLEQPIFHYAHMHGRGFLSGQAAKKLEEAASTREGMPFITEILGAIVYLGAAVIYERSKQTEVESSTDWNAVFNGEGK